MGTSLLALAKSIYYLARWLANFYYQEEDRHKILVYARRGHLPNECRAPVFLAGLPRARRDYGQPLFVWLSRDWPSVRTYASTDCTGGVGETIKRKGGVSQACLARSTSFTLDIHNMVNRQLSKQDSHWLVSHDRIAGSCVNSLRRRDLFGSCPLTS